MDFPLRSMSVFLFVRSPVLWMSGFEMIRQTETKLYTNRNPNIITVVAAALRINDQTPSTGLLSSARFKYQLCPLACLPSFNSLFVLCVYREDFRS